MTSSTFISDNQIDISSFEIYPNPILDNNITVVYDILSNESQLEIFSITGEKVYNQDLNGSGFQAKSFVLPNLKKGIYIVKVTSSISSIQKKLVVQ